MNILKIMVLVPIFIILWVVIFHTVRSAFDFSELCSIILSVCVSLLSVIGMDHYLRGSVEVILLPYAAMAIAILLTLLFSFVGKHSKEAKGRWSNRTIKEDDRNIEQG